MKKNTFLPKIVLADTTNMTSVSNWTIWRGNDFLKFTLQLKITAMNVKIYASNVEDAKSADWIDMTTYFTANPTISADTMLMQSDEVCVLWWKLEWTKTNASNRIKADLYQYVKNND